MKYTVSSIYLDANKQYLVKRYYDGTYYINQTISGKVFYRRWTKTTASYAKYLRTGYHGQPLKTLTLSISKTWTPSQRRDDV